MKVYRINGDEYTIVSQFYSPDLQALTESIAPQNYTNEETKKLFNNVLSLSLNNLSCKDYIHLITDLEKDNKVIVNFASSNSDTDDEQNCFGIGVLYSLLSLYTGEKITKDLLVIKKLIDMCNSDSPIVGDYSYTLLLQRGLTFILLSGNINIVAKDGMIGGYVYYVLNFIN